MSEPHGRGLGWIPPFARDAGERSQDSGGGRRLAGQLQGRIFRHRVKPPCFLVNCCELCLAADGGDTLKTVSKDSRFMGFLRNLESSGPLEGDSGGERRELGTYGIRLKEDA